MKFVQRPFSRKYQVNRYQNVSILDFIGAKDDGRAGDIWSSKTCKAPVKSSPPTYQHPALLQAGCPSCHPTNSVRALKPIRPTVRGIAHPSSPGALPTLSWTAKGSWRYWGGCEASRQPSVASAPLMGFYDLNFGWFG